MMKKMILEKFTEEIRGLLREENIYAYHLTFGVNQENDSFEIWVYQSIIASQRRCASTYKLNSLDIISASRLKAFIKLFL